MGTCFLNLICITPRLVIDFHQMFDYFCLAYLASGANLDYFSKFPMCNTVFSKERLQFDLTVMRAFEPFWLIALGANCFGVIIHIQLSNTYRSSFVKVMKKLFCLCRSKQTATVTPIRQ